MTDPLEPDAVPPFAVIWVRIGDYDSEPKRTEATTLGGLPRIRIDHRLIDIMLRGMDPEARISYILGDDQFPR